MSNKRTRMSVFKLRVAKSERTTWQRIADEEFEGNLSRYVRKVMNEHTAARLGDGGVGKPAR